MPDYSQPSAKLCCAKSCSGGGNLPNGPLVPCPACPGAKYPESCPTNYCKLSPLARVIISAVRIRAEGGVTEEQILEEHNEFLCPNKPLSAAEVHNLVRLALQRGALRRISTGNLAVYAFFADLPSNLSLAEELGPHYQLCLGMFCDSNGR